MQCQPDDVAANISLGLNSISLFPPTCSVVAEYKCPNTTLHYFSLFCSVLLFLQGKFSLLMPVHNITHTQCTECQNVCIIGANLLTHTYTNRNKPASDLNVPKLTLDNIQRLQMTQDDSIDASNDVG